MDVAVGWLAIAAAPVGPPRMGDFLIPAMWLVGGLLVAAVILAALRSYGQKAQGSTDPLHDQMARFRTLYQQGQMSKEEFDRVRGLLAEKIREKELAEGKPTAAPPAVERKPAPAQPRETAEFEPVDPEEPTS